MNLTNLSENASTGSRKTSEKDLGILSSSVCYSDPVLSPLFPGSGSCRFSYADPSIIVSYSLSGTTNTSDDWITLEKIRSVSFLMHPTVSSSVTDTHPLLYGPILFFCLFRHNMKIYCSV